MAISININGESYDVNGVDHPAEEETLKKLLATFEKYTKDDKDRQDKLLKEFKTQLSTLNKTEAGSAPKYGTTSQMSAADAQAQKKARAEFNQATQGQSLAMRKMAQDVNSSGSGLVKILGFMGSAFDTVTSVLGGFGKVIGGMVGIAGSAASALLSLGTAAIGAYMQAAKFQGELAKGGATFATGVQGLNSAAISVGSTMEELSTVMLSQRQNFALLGTATETGAKRFFDLAVAARNSEQNLRALGYTSAEEIAVRGEYMGLLQAMGKADLAQEELRSGAMAKNSTKMIKGFMGVAAAAGTTVDELLKKAKEIAGDHEFGLTVEALGLTADQTKNLTANMAALDKMGLGALNKVLLETENWGTSVGETGKALKELGMGPAVERFLVTLKNTDPSKMQERIIEFSKTLPNNQIAQFASKLDGMGGDAGKVANIFRNLSKQSVESARELQKQAAAGDKSVEAAKALEERFNKLKGELTGFLLKLSESKEFRKALDNMLGLLETYGPTTLEAFFKIVTKGYEIFNALFSEQGRRALIDSISEQFLDILIGIKTAVLRPLKMYSQEMEDAERAAFKTEHARQMAVAKLNDDSLALRKAEEQLSLERIKYYTATNEKDRNAANDRVEELKKQIKAIRDANDDIVKKAPVTQQAEAAKKKSEQLGTGNMTLGISAVAVGAISLFAFNYLKNKLTDKIFGVDPNARQGGWFGRKVPTTLPGPEGAAPGAGGVSALQSLKQGLAGAVTWAAKGAAIATSMYLIGKALPTLADGMKSLADVKWQDMVSAGAIISGFGAALAALGQIPLATIGKGLVGLAAVSGAMVLVAFGFKQLNPELLAFQELKWQTITGALATLVGIGAIGAAAGALIEFILPGAVALGALGLALRAFPTDVLEALGKLFESVGAAIGTVVTRMAEGIGLIVDKIAALRNSGVEATTEQIERLSKIPSDQLFAAARGVQALKEALDGFGGGFWENIGRGITGMFGSDRVSEIERAAAAMDKYKASVSVLQQMGTGEYVLKPVDVALYTQLQQTLDETKGKINTTFASETYKKTLVGTKDAIDATYNAKKSGLDKILEAVKEAIKVTFAVPKAELDMLQAAIRSAILGGIVGDSSRTVSNIDDAILEQYIKTVSSGEGGAQGWKAINKSGKNPTYAAGRIQLKPENIVGLTGGAGGLTQYAGTFKGKGKKEIAEAFTALSPEEQKKFERLYLERNRSILGNVLGRDPTFRELVGANFGPGFVAKAVKNPGAPLDAQDKQAVAGNPAIFGKTMPSNVGDMMEKVYAYYSRSSGTPLGSSTPTSGPRATNAGLTAGTDISRTAHQVEVKDGKVVIAGTNKQAGIQDTLTGVDQSSGTEEKILNLLEQTYNLHADHYKSGDRFKGFTAFTR